MATPLEPPGPPRRAGLTDAQKWTLGGIAAVVVLLVLVVATLAGDDDGGDEDAGPTTTTAETTTTTTPGTTTSEPAESTTTATFRPDVDPYDVAFPSPEGSRSFETPAAAARAYATDVLGFTELVLGAPAVAGGEAEVVVQASEDGPESRIHLVGAGDAWYVTGSTTEDVTVTQPAPGTSLATPFQTAGQALAFEGSVEVLVLTQDDPAPLGSGTVTGSGSPPAGPFAGDITFTPPPAAAPGVLVYRILSPADGRVLQATSLRVRLTNLTA